MIAIFNGLCAQRSGRRGGSGHRRAVPQRRVQQAGIGAQVRPGAPDVGHGIRLPGPLRDHAKVAHHTGATPLPFLFDPYPL